MNCVECEFPLRPRRRTLAAYPGTRENKGFGVCTTCWCRRHRQGEARDAQQVRTFDVRLAQVALEAYMVERRKRRAANGLAA